jgi:rubrerythrin
MLEAAQEFPPSSKGDASALALARLDYAEEAGPIGTMPPPTSLVQGAKTAAKLLRGRQPMLFLDKLGERLAFERTGTRLYEGLLAKMDGGFRGGPSRRDLERIMREEHAHFALLRDAMERLGGDPTAVTPSADVQATASQGIAAVIVDPRTTLVEGLEAILIAELADNDCWDALIALADGAGEAELVNRFSAARDHEREHLANVRAWLAAAQSRPVVAGAPSAPAMRRPAARGRRANAGKTRRATGRSTRARTPRRTKARSR